MSRGKVTYLAWWAPRPIIITYRAAEDVGSCLPWLTALTLSLCRHLALGYRLYPQRSAGALQSHEDRPINTHTLDPCIIYSRSLLRKEGTKDAAGRTYCRQRWGRSMEMWGLITVSLASRLHGTAACACRAKTGSTLNLWRGFLTRFTIHTSVVFNSA